MPEFNLAEALQRLAPSATGQPEQSYETSMKTMGNMETDRKKHEELQNLFRDMMEFKNMKASGQLPKDYSVPTEMLQQWHKETAPSLSEQEFQNVIATFKDVVGGGTAPNTSQDAQQSITQQESTEPQGNPTKDNYVPSGSNMGDVLLAALASMSNAPAEYNLGGKLQGAVESKQRMGLEKQREAMRERTEAMQAKDGLLEKQLSAAQKQEAQDAIIEQRKLDRDARVQSAKELIAQREADRAQRASDAAERRTLSQQFQDQNLQIRKDMLELSKTKMSRIPPSKAQEVGSKIQSIQRYADLGLTFQDKYAGSIVGGPTVTAISERLGKKQDRVNWWKNFKMLDVKLRNELFGATLTNNEQKSWDSVTVSENSDPAFVKRAMATRAKIAQDALNRELEAYSDAGYDVNKLKGSANRPLPKF